MLDPQFNGYEEDPKKQKGLSKRIADLRAKLSKVDTRAQAALDKVAALEVTCDDAYQTFDDRRSQEMNENMALIWNDTGGGVRLKWARWRHKKAQVNLEAAKDNLRNQQHPDIRGTAIKLIMGKLSK